MFLPFGIDEVLLLLFCKSSLGLSKVCSSMINSFSEFESDEQLTSFRTCAAPAVSEIEDIVGVNDFVDETTGIAVRLLVRGTSLNLLSPA